MTRPKRPESPASRQRKLPPFYQCTPFLASKVHRNRRLFPVLQLFDQRLEVLQLLLHVLLRIEGIPGTPVLTSVAQRIKREHLVNVPPGTFDPDGEFGVDDVVPMFQSAKKLAVVFIVPIDFVFRQNTSA